MGKLRTYAFAAVLFYSSSAGRGLDQIEGPVRENIQPLKIEGLLRDLGKHELMLWDEEFRVYLGDEGVRDFS